MSPLRSSFHICIVPNVPVPDGVKTDRFYLAENGDLVIMTNAGGYTHRVDVSLDHPTYYSFDEEKFAVKTASKGDPFFPVDLRTLEEKLLPLLQETAELIANYYYALCQFNPNTLDEAHQQKWSTRDTPGLVQDIEAKMFIRINNDEFSLIPDILLKSKAWTTTFLETHIDYDTVKQHVHRIVSKWLDFGRP